MREQDKYSLWTLCKTLQYRKVFANAVVDETRTPLLYKGAHKTVILKITIMASVRRDWQRNNGYLVRTGYPLFFCRHEKQ